MGIEFFTDEVWRDVPGFEGSYQVSNYGRVLSVERTCSNGRWTRRVRQRIMKQNISMSKGKPESCCVKLSRPEGRHEYATVGRLVLSAFVRPAKPGEIAHFLDGDPTNARVENMEWSTYSAVAVAAGYRPPGRKNQRTY